MDFVRGIRYIYDAALREKAWQWAAAKLDGLEADGSFSSEMVKRDGTIHPVSYRLDLTACQHQGCRSIYSVDTTVSSLPESYYLHFSETTTLDWIKPDGTFVKRVTIPGCPSGTAISKSCRVQLWLWDDSRWVFNVNDPGFQSWQANRLLASLKNGQKGMFLDEHAANIIDAWRWGRSTKAVSGGGVRELGGNRPSYGTATTLYQTMVVNWMVVFRNKAKAAGKYLMPNLSQEATDAWGIKESLAAGGVSIEFLHRPDAFDGSSGHFERYVQLIKDLVAIGGVADLAGTLCYYGPSGYTAGNYGSSKARYWMWRLAAYYLVRESAGSPARIYFNPGLCTKNWSTDPLGWTKEWLPAYEKSIGSPSGDAYKIKTGSYSYSTSSGTKTCGYKVFARNYTGGMVLVRTKDAWNCTNWGDQSAQTVSLPRSLRVLKEDGTLGTAASTAKIRNGEALVLKNP
jgi:hypothetical protein